MSGLEFASATIGQLVWPVLILVVLYLLRDQIRLIAASPRLRRLKAGPSGVEIELDSQVERQLEEAKRELNEPGATKGLEFALSPPVDEWEAYNGGDFYREMRKLAELSPRSVVLETHARLEALLREASVAFPSHRPGRPSVRKLAQLAGESDFLSRQEV